MKGSKYKLAIILILLGKCLFSQNSFLYGDANNNSFIDAFIDEDENMIFVSGISSTGNASFSKIDFSGNLQWTKQYNGINAAFIKIIKAPNGDFLIFANPNENFLVLRVNNLGDVIWSKTYSSGRERSGRFSASIDDTYIISGSYTQQGTSDDVLVMRIDGNGDIMWSKILNDHDDQLGGVTTNGNGGVVLTGGLHIIGGNLNCFVAEIDNAGNPVYMKEYDLPSQRDDNTKIMRTSDGGYLISGFTVSSSWDNFIMKLQPDFSIDWNARLTNNRVNNAVFSMTEDNLGNYHITSQTVLDNIIIPITFIFDSSGSLLFSKRFNNMPWIKTKVFSNSDRLLLWSTIPIGSSLAQYGQNDGVIEITNTSLNSCHATDHTLSVDTDIWNVFDWTPSITDFSLDITVNTITATDVTYMSKIACGATIDCCEIIIPQGISPNNDGKNDFFNVENIENYPNHSIEIFNRYGKRVYKGNNSTPKWDGTHNGKKMPDGTYFYAINLNENTLPRTVKQTFHGWIYLNGQ